MHCRKCRIKMKEERRVFHGKRKWICPACGRARMQMVEKPDRKKPAPDER
ncbi:MAG: hypothetical protein IT350_05525 [Deltaproteobacteria bacterium]|nr:hypothetical protein [Deltaproteobacteria bacterium]